jgi:hypothetical protein
MKTYRLRLFACGLVLATWAVSCALNPQPEPPGVSDSTPTAGGAGGAAGSGGAGVVGGYAVTGGTGGATGGTGGGTGGVPAAGGWPVVTDAAAPLDAGPIEAGTEGAAPDAPADAPDGDAACTYADEYKTCVGRNAADCSGLKFGCPDAETYFADTCGCGCLSTVRLCERVQCARAIICVEQCGGPVISAGCCPCAAPAFESMQCPKDAGTAG